MKFSFRKSSIKVKNFYFIFCIVTMISCNKFVDLDAPPNALASDNVYSTDATAIAVLTGLYTKMSNNTLSFVTGQSSISVWAGLSSDELTLASTNATLVRFYSNKLSNGDNFPWRSIYSCIVTANTAIEQLPQANSLTPSVRNQLIGEAKFLRAFSYFYLVNLYGDVPLSLTSDYRLNNVLPRSSKEQVYDQIVLDLKDAQTLLSENWYDASLKVTTNERDRPNKWAATSLLARVYLFRNDWANAEIQATSVLSSTLFNLSSIDKTFLKASQGNKESIWQLQPVNAGWNTEDARIFVLNAAPGTSKPVYLDTLLVKSFEAGDLRRSNWVKEAVFSGKTYSYPYKYKNATSGLAVTEYLMMIRLSEIYLIRAEARAQQNKIGEAMSDIDKVRQRAGLPLLVNTNPLISKTALIDTILHERQVELFTEWGHRWLDLKRAGKLDGVMSVVTPLKGGSWNPYWNLYPIPLHDLQYNLNLVQNPGY